jgi:hypothetical protein
VVALALSATASAIVLFGREPATPRSGPPSAQSATAPDAVARVLPEPAPAPPARPCHAQDVVPTFVGVSVAPGSKWLEFRLSNMAADQCQLAGDPLVTATRGNDPPVLASRGVVVAGFPDAGPAATIGPGDAARLSVIVAGECQNEKWLASGRVVMPAAVDLTLPGGVLRLAVPDDVGHQFRPDGLCPFMVSGFQHWRK